MANKELVAENAEDKDVADVANEEDGWEDGWEDNEAVVGDVVDKKIDEKDADDTRGLIDCHLTYLVL
jgi:hypothetical protein